MADLTKPELRLIHPTWKGAAPAGVDALFTLRSGGVSSGPWGDASGIMGLNVAPHTGDNATCVRMNREMVAQLVPTDPVWLNQVHSTRVVTLKAGEALTDNEADAAVTKDANVVCTVMVADCMPVLFTNEKGTAVGAAHAGWRGLNEGVLEATIDALKALDPEGGEILAWVGPHIGMDDFEVGDDLIDAFLEKDADLANEKYFRRDPVTGKAYCSLVAIAVKRLRAAGLGSAKIFTSGQSTAADKEQFYSYRRDGEKSGRHAAMIWIKG